MRRDASSIFPSAASQRSHCWSMAAFRKNASIIGAGPLIVIDTEAFGSHRSKPE